MVFTLKIKWVVLAVAWENSQHLATLPLLSPPNDVWETRAEIPYWWRVTTQIWVVLLMAVSRAKFDSINQFLNQLMKKDLEKPTCISWTSASSFINQFSLARLREWNLWLEVIETLIITLPRFDWISAVSRKVLALLESALRYFFEVLKCLWQLSTTSQDQLSEKGPVHTQVSLKCTSNALQVHLKSPVWTSRVTYGKGFLLLLSETFDLRKPPLEYRGQNFFEQHSSQSDLYLVHVYYMYYVCSILQTIFPPTKFTSRTSVRAILTIPSVVPINGTNKIDLRVFKNQPINARGSDPDPVAWDSRPR